MDGLLQQLVCVYQGLILSQYDRCDVMGLVFQMELCFMSWCSCNTRVNMHVSFIDALSRKPQVLFNR